MKFGINLLNFGECATPGNFSVWARFAEEYGFHALMISDHVAVTPDVYARYPTPFFDPFTILSWLATATSRIELGTTVTILPYRHPLQTARLTANIDVLSGGRFIFGVGVGWAQEEFRALGIPFDRRGGISNECLAVIRQCWRQEVTTYEGRFFSFRDVHTGPMPVRQPPIWVGGSSDAALRRAVRYGDAWHPIRIRVDWFRDHGLPRLREIAQAEKLKVPRLCPRLLLDITPEDMAEDKRVAGQGSIEQIRSDVAALEELGVEYVVWDTYSGNPRDTQSLGEHWDRLRIVRNLTENP